MSVSDLLSRNLRVPGYQRPYRWTTKNIADLLGDIDTAIGFADSYAGFRYRIGSVILHNNTEDGCLDLVDGQQRMLSLVLLMLCLDERASCPLLERSSFSNRETQANIQANYDFIREWIGYQSESWREEARKAYSTTLEAVVIEVDRIEEAFQLFDSQNTRGRSLDPHDLLKAYHLRAMRENPDEMRHVVTRWEEFAADDVREIFARFLFPTLNWKMKEKTRPFTAKEIDAYKGVAERSGYTYAARARRAAPCFQIGSPFIEGEDFFLMAEHYLQMRRDIEIGLNSNTEFQTIRDALERKNPTAGYRHARTLFLCVLLAYYDRFHNFDERAVKKLFAWAFMIRVDMTSLGFDSVNKYAVGEDNGRFTNVVPMFSRIARARDHADIANIRIEVTPAPDGSNDERRDLAKVLAEWSKGGRRAQGKACQDMPLSHRGPRPHRPKSLLRDNEYQRRAARAA